MDRVVTLCIAVAALGLAGSACAEGDATKGEAYVKRTCGTCHTAAKDGGNRIGPNLFGVFGRHSASIADFHYSAGLQGLNITWDEAHLRAWLTNPRAVVPATKMTFAGILKPADLDDVIAYLKTNK